MGQGVAATVLGGNYPGTSSRLISPAFTLPSLPPNETVVLRFWHWFNIDPNDRAVVQISQNGGDWQDISGQFVNSSGVWTQFIVDLTAYAGSQVRLGFLLTYGGGGARQGWYLDEVTVESGPPGQRYLEDGVEDFESGIGDWFPDQGVWEVGAPSSGPGGCFSGSTACASTVLGGNYPGTSSRLISPAFTLTTAPGETPQLRFQHWFNIDPNDRAVVQISQNGGDWQDISGSFTNSSGVWTQFIIDLTTYAGSQVRLGFLLTYGGGGARQGWYLDDIIIEGIEVVAPPPISVAPTTVGFGNVLVGASATEQVTVSNTGTETLNTSSIAITGADVALFDVDTTPFSLAVGQSRNLDVGFTPQAVGSFSAVLVLESNVDTVGVNLSGAGVTAPIEVSPPTIDFGEVVVGGAATAELTVSYPGTSDANVTAITITGADAAQFSVDTTPFTLAPGASKTLAVSFTPQSVGTFSAVLVLESDVGTTEVTLSGTTSTGVAVETEAIPTSFVLHGAYPNPFNPSTTIRFDLPEPAAVTLQIFDVLGHEVQRLDAGHLPPGRHHEIRVVADGLASGVYFYRVVMHAARRVEARTGRFVLLK